MSRCPVLAACIVAGYDPARVVVRDFTQPAAFVTPVRKPQRPPPNPRERKRCLWEGECVACGEPFSRTVIIDGDPPETCSVACAAQLRWNRAGERAFGKRNRGPGRFGRPAFQRQA